MLRHRRSSLAGITEIPDDNAIRVRHLFSASKRNVLDEFQDYLQEKVDSGEWEEHSRSYWDELGRVVRALLDQMTDDEIIRHVENAGYTSIGNHRSALVHLRAAAERPLRRKKSM